MKILYIANIRIPTEKAHGVQIMKMCEAFTKLGHEVTLVVPERKNPIHADPFVYYAIKTPFRIVHMRCLDGLRFWGKIGFGIQTLSFALAVHRYGRQIQPNLIYTRDPGIVFVLSLFGYASVWEMHTAAFGFFVRRAIRRAVQIVTISGGLKEFLIEHHVPSSVIEVAHDAVEAEEFEVSEDKKDLRAKLALPQDRKILTYVGKFHTMGHAKGVKELVGFAGEAAKKYPQLLLLIVGLDPADLPKAEAAASRAGLHPEQFRFIGHVPRGDVPKYLHASDLLLMNYPNTTHYARMMSPLKLFEYMASGVPILTTDLPSLREVISDREAYFVPPDTDSAYIQTILSIFRHPDEATIRGQAALHIVKQHSWTGRAKKILAHINHE